METIWSRALGKLLRVGWRKGPRSGETDYRRLCLVEALSYTNEGKELFTEKVGDHLGLVPGINAIDSRKIIQWNDAPERTFTEVKQLLTELHEKELAERGAL